MKSRNDSPLDKSEIQENLLALYLRLNGYFVSGFIAHSDQPGNAVTEIDALAVRFPFSSEPERQVGPSPYMEPSGALIDLLICEVKSKGESLQFNHSLRDSLCAVKKVLRWAGLFDGCQIAELAPDLQRTLQPTNPARQDMIMVKGPNKTRIRAMVCCPERDRKHRTQPWFLNGSEMFGYITKCLRPPIPRFSCATRYDFRLWGRHLERLVRCFKEGAEPPGTMNDLYTYFCVR